MKGDVMVTKVLPGGISRDVRRIEKPDNVSVQVSSQPKLVVLEYGDVRCLPISRRVAEVLIACGFNYGD
jgi:hypothetical protein